MTEQSAKNWRPLGSLQRRVLGVLVEKAKTTPDAYPMTINGIVTGCNQKSNREPLLSVTADEVEQTLEELRGLGAVTEVQGTGRVNKYRHHAYEWLGVDKTESAVMTELLLRGEQTLGDLRARAARMEPIADLTALRPILESLAKKGLLIELTPAGRGQVVSHNLYKERELTELRRQFANYTPPAGHDSGESDHSARPASPPPSPAAAAAPQRPGSGGAPPSESFAAAASLSALRDQIAELTVELHELRAEFARMRDRVETIEQQLR